MNPFLTYTCLKLFQGTSFVNSNDQNVERSGTPLPMLAVDAGSAGVDENGAIVNGTIGVNDSNDQDPWDGGGFADDCDADDQGVPLPPLSLSSPLGTSGGVGNAGSLWKGGCQNTFPLSPADWILVVHSLLQRADGIAALTPLLSEWIFLQFNLMGADCLELWERGDTHSFNFVQYVLVYVAPRSVNIVRIPFLSRCVCGALLARKEPTLTNCPCCGRFELCPQDNNSAQEESDSSIESDSVEMSSPLNHQVLDASALNAAPQVPQHFVPHLKAFDARTMESKFHSEKNGRGLPGIMAGNSRARKQLRKCVDELVDYVRLAMEKWVQSERFDNHFDAWESFIERMAEKYGLGDSASAQVNRRIVVELVKRLDASKERENRPFSIAYESVLGILNKVTLEQVLGRQVGERVFRKFRLLALDAPPGVQRTHVPRNDRVSVYKKVMLVIKVVVDNSEFGMSRRTVNVTGSRGTLLTQLICEATGWNPEEFPRIKLKKPVPWLIAEVCRQNPYIGPSFVRSLLQTNAICIPGATSGHCPRCASHFYEPLALLKRFLTSSVDADVGRALELLRMYEAHFRKGEFYDACTVDSHCATHNITFAYGCADISSVDPTVVCMGCAALIQLGAIPFVSHWHSWRRIFSEFQQHQAHILRTKYAHTTRMRTVEAVNTDTTKKEAVVALLVDHAVNQLPRQPYEPMNLYFGKLGTVYAGGECAYQNPKTGKQESVSFHGLNGLDRKKDALGCLAWVMCVAVMIASRFSVWGIACVLLSVACDNAAAFHSKEFMSVALAASVFEATKGLVKVTELVYSEPGEGKSILDQRFSVILGLVSRWVKAGNAVLGALGFVNAFRQMGARLGAIVMQWIFGRDTSSFSSLPIPPLLGKHGVTSFRYVAFEWSGDRVISARYFRAKDIEEGSVLVPVDEDTWSKWQDWARTTEAKPDVNSVAVHASDAAWIPKGGVGDQSPAVPLERTELRSDNIGNREGEIMSRPGGAPPLHFGVIFSDNNSRCPVCKLSWEKLDPASKFLHLKSCCHGTKDHWGDSGPSACPLCERVFVKDGAVPAHVFREHCGGKFVCLHCKKVHATRSAACTCHQDIAGQIHLLQRYSCADCGRRYEKQFYLARHECQVASKQRQQCVEQVRNLMNTEVICIGVLGADVVQLPRIPSEEPNAITDGHLGLSLGYAAPSYQWPEYPLDIRSRFLLSRAFALGRVGILPKRSSEELISLHSYLFPGLPDLRKSEILSAWGCSGAQEKEGAAIDGNKESIAARKVGPSEEELKEWRELVRGMAGGNASQLPPTISAEMRRFSLLKTPMPELVKRLQSMGIATDTPGLIRGARKEVLAKRLLDSSVSRIDHQNADLEHVVDDEDDDEDDPDFRSIADGYDSVESSVEDEAFEGMLCLDISSLLF